MYLLVYLVLRLVMAWTVGSGASAMNCLRQKLWLVVAPDEMGR